LQGDGLDWVRGRTHLELGKLASRSSGAAPATNAFRVALQICEAAEDEICVKESKEFLRSK